MRMIYFVRPVQHALDLPYSERSVNYVICPACPTCPTCYILLLERNFIFKSNIKKIIKQKKSNIYKEKLDMLDKLD
jgi:hypothetical protein